MKKEGYTPEIVWAMLADVAERQKETDRIIKESQAEATLQIKELRESQKESQAEATLQIKELRDSQAKTDQQIDKLTENVRNLNNDVGGIENSTGDFAEDYFFNSFEHGKRNFFGENFDEIKKNVPGGKPNTEYHDEYDIVLYNCRSIGIIEVKFKARPYHIKKTIEKVETFRAVYPQYADHKIYLAIAAMSFHLDTEEKCKKEGIAVIKQVGDHTVIYEDNLTAY
jgi:hypothetical protein